MREGHLVDLFLYSDKDPLRPSAEPFDLLLLVMFSLSARMIPQENVSKDSLGLAEPETGSFYFEQAKSALGKFI